MIIGVDTGGTKTLVARFDNNGEIISSRRFPTSRDEMTYITEVRTAIGELAETRPVSAISVAVPGIVTDNVVKICPNLGWKNFDVAHLLSKHFPDSVITIENDANLGGLGEVCLRGLKEADSILYVTISTGIGTGLIAKGRIDTGMRLTEGGHMVLEFNGQLQDWEDFSSGRAFYEMHDKFGSEVSDPTIWKDFADRISRGLIALIPTIQPNAVIIGGSMGEHYHKYEVALDEYLQERLPEIASKPPIVAALHPSEAVIYGCYYHVVDR